MRQMKDSGIEWIGEIPENWGIISFWQAIERMGTGLNPRDNFELTKEDNLFYVTIRNFKDGRLFLDNNCDRISQKAWDIIQSRSDLHKGDIIFASISKDGQAYILDDEPNNWNINESVFCIRINKSYYHEKYFYYHLIDTGYYSDLRMDATGSTFQSIKQNKLRKSRMVLPPLPEQQAISAHLDKQCAHIDNIIEKTKASIEEYKKLRQAVITQAVTKGVRGDRPMKDSGIEWIGEIPEEWSISHIGNLAEIGSGGTPNRNRPEYWINGDIPWMSSGEINLEYVNDTAEKITQLGMKNSNAKLLPVNTVMLGLIGQGKTKGLTAILNIESTCNQNLAYLIPNKMLFYKYLFYCFKSMYNYIRGLIGDSQAGIYQGFLKKQHIPLPLFSEQQEISAYLDKKCTEIDSLISKKEQFLTELESYKKSMIYEYVTGKKEVPQA